MKRQQPSAGLEKGGGGRRFLTCFTQGRAPTYSRACRSKSSFTGHACARRRGGWLAAPDGLRRAAEIDNSKNHADFFCKKHLRGGQNMHGASPVW